MLSHSTHSYIAYLQLNPEQERRLLWFANGEGDDPAEGNAGEEGENVENTSPEDEGEEAGLAATPETTSSEGVIEGAQANATNPVEEKSKSTSRNANELLNEIMQESDSMDKEQVNFEQVALNINIATEIGIWTRGLANNG